MEPGIKEVVGLVLDGKLKNYDETSRTFSESSVPEVDNRRTSEYYAPIDAGNSRVEGDWRIGLTAEEVKIINEECGVPIFTPASRLFLHHGKRFDMSNPIHVAEYRILATQNLVALGKRNVASGQRYYWHDEANIAREREIERNIKRNAIKMDDNYSDEEKADLLMLISFERKLGISNNLTKEMAREAFADLAYNNPRDLVEVEALTHKDYRLLLHRAFTLGILFKEGDRGMVTRPSGVKLADTFEDAVKLVAEDLSLQKEITEKISGKNTFDAEAIRKVTSGQPVPIRKYNTKIEDEKSVGYWNKEACVQYFKENLYEVKLSEGDGVERWRNLVIKVHRREQTDEAVFVGGASTKDEAVLNDLSIRAASWEKPQCIAFLEANSELLASKGFVERIVPTHGVPKSREITLRAIALLSPEEVQEILGKTDE